MGRQLKKVSTTLHKRRPDALSRTPAKVSELEYYAELVIFPVAFLQWHKQPSYIGRLLSGGLTPTTSISFERNWESERNSSSIPPSLLQPAWLWSISRIWTCACIRVTRATTTNWLGNDAKTVATTVSTTRRGRRKEGFEKLTLDNFWEWQQVNSCSLVFVLPFERK